MLMEDAIAMSRAHLIIALALVAVGCGNKEPAPVTGAPDTGSEVSDTAEIPEAGAPKALRIYLAGESIERRNRFVAPPFETTGALATRGGGDLRNDNEEYGWMVPLASRLSLRDPRLTVTWVGTEDWSDADDGAYSGTWPSTTPGKSSAISGTTIDAWLEQRRGELTAKTFCYDVAIAARGGNDFGLDDDAALKASLKDLVGLLAAGSSCQANPLVYVTGHMPDDQRGGSGSPDDATYVGQQKQRFVARFRDAVTELSAAKPTLRLRFVDLYTPFLDNKPTTAFPSEVWSKGGVPDYVKIGRVGDLMHIRRLASIYVGELFADAMNLSEVRTP